MPGLGDEFRAAREARHLSLSDVSEQIHIRSVYLESIENEDWSAIAAPVYVRGFLRTYARFLGLDAESAVEDYNATLGEATRAREPSPVASARARGPSVWVWLGTAVAFLLVGFVGYQYWEFQQSDRAGTVAVGEASPSAAPATDAPSDAPPSAAPSESPEASPAPTPSAKTAPARTLEVRLTQPSWLLVRVDGAQAAEGLFPAGTRKSFHGKKVDVRAGNAGGVDLVVNGKELGSMGHAGDVVERTFQLAAEE
jgi:cytoskeletal protein RodZ